jgi:DNA-directed RNA polymerase subunit RPC12/RpoP
VELYRTRQAQLRRCSSCSEEHLVFTERPQCPLCQLMARTFCRRCGAQLADHVRHTTLYCPDCSSSAIRVAERRRARRRRHSLTGWVNDDSRCRFL